MIGAFTINVKILRCRSFASLLLPWGQTCLKGRQLFLRSQEALSPAHYYTNNSLFSLSSSSASLFVPSYRSPTSHACTHTCARLGLTWTLPLLSYHPSALYNQQSNAKSRTTFTQSWGKLRLLYALHSVRSNVVGGMHRLSPTYLSPGPTGSLLFHYKVGKNMKSGPWLPGLNPVPPRTSCVCMNIFPKLWILKISSFEEQESYSA